MVWAWDDNCSWRWWWDLASRPAATTWWRADSPAWPPALPHLWPCYAEVSHPATTLSYFAKFQEASASLQKSNDHLLNQGHEHLYEPVLLLPAHKHVIMTILIWLPPLHPSMLKRLVRLLDYLYSTSILYKSLANKWESLLSFLNLNENLFMMV